MTQEPNQKVDWQDVQPKLRHPDQTNLGERMVEQIPLQSPKDEFRSLLSEYHKHINASISPISLANDPTQQVESPINPISEQYLTENSSESTMPQQSPSDQEIKEEEDTQKVTVPKQKKIKKTNQKEEPQKSNMAKEKREGKKGRQDDNNNAHKKMITALNQVLAKCGMLYQIKKDLKQAKKVFQKGSRYSFVCRLIDAQQKFSKEKFDDFLRLFCEMIKERFQLPIKSNRRDQLLKSLIPIYDRSCKLIAQKISIEAAIQSVCVLYDLPTAKEKTYKSSGVQSVKDYIHQRYPLYPQ